MRYTDQNTHQKPLSMAAAIALNGAIIVAVALSPMVAGPPAERIITKIYSVPKPVIPPPDAKVEPKVEPKTFDPVYTPKSIIDPILSDDAIQTADDPPTDNQSSIAGAGKGGSDDFREVVEKTPIVLFTKAKRDSRFARDFQPSYPASLLAREVEGSATIRVLVGTDGRVHEAIVVSATHPAFGKAAVQQALKSWRFTPAKRGDEAVEDWVTIPVTFQIN